MKDFWIKISAGIAVLCLLLSAVPAGADALLPATRPTHLLSPVNVQSVVSAASAATFARRPWLPHGFHAVRDIPYVLHGRRSQMLDVYEPDIATAPRPLMVWVHGGGWSSGDKSAPPGMGLLLRGYAVASLNYRLSSEAVFPAQIFDCKAAVRFLRAHAREFDIDPARIVVWGDSAGGQLAALLGITNGRPEYEGTEGNAAFSSSVQAVCDWFGPSDFLQAADIHGASGIAVKSLFGGSVADRKDLATFASPAQQVGRRVTVPFLIMHGQVDSLVPVHQSQLLFQRLRAAQANVRLVILPRTGHGNGWFRSRKDLDMVYDFFDRCLHRGQGRVLAATTRPAA